MVMEQDGQAMEQNSVGSLSLKCKMAIQLVGGTKKYILFYICLKTIKVSQLLTKMSNIVEIIIWFTENSKIILKTDIHCTDLLNLISRFFTINL